MTTLVEPESKPFHALATGAGVTVAVIDTGITPHPHIARLDPGTDLVSPQAPNSLHDCDGHGTIVAGIIAGQEHGIAPNVRIVSIKQTSAFTQQEDTGGSLETLAHAIHDALDHQAKVINVSVVSCVPPAVATQIDASILDQALARAEQENALVVAAAGNVNQGCEPGFFVFPAHYPTVVAVGARATEYTLADYSLPVPPEQDFVSAPGMPTAALSPSGEGFAIGMKARSSDVSEPFTGTSFAAPVISGIAALLVERYPDDSAEELRQRIYTAAEPHGGFLSPHAALTEVVSRDAPRPHPVALSQPQEQHPFAYRRSLVAITLLLAGAAVVVFIAGLKRTTNPARASRMPS
ncbi:S8 family serine peptidase [Corynebacterium breve]|uniref:S8 family serine peptidase n=1 Tax=Corynebacterium breve TaxID=3049799 RepID=A0ABY8VIV6_9CORY|nr:S8 family serine peptidase [Corynebacterium breve]WIM68134.1 S8 family serine peptidase [Corynebacterium breve]